jgi:hypothetical protein
VDLKAAATDPALVGQALALGRIGVGTAFLLAPRALFGRAMRTGRPSEETVVALRMFAARDLALGLGALIAARQGSGGGRGLRGWLEGGALADASDALAFAPAGSLRPLARWGVSLLAAAAAACGSATARRL